jgi:23S rRNA (guanosine2251-2'-O)-methyltransferase
MAEKHEKFARNSEHGPLLIYGMNSILEAVRAGAAKKIFIGEGRREKIALLLKEAEKSRVPVEYVKPDFFLRLPKGHQSVAARAGEKKFSTLEKVLEIPEKKGETGFLLALDGVEDPRNLGAIMRTALAAGVHGLIIQKHRQAGLGPDAFKASAGAAWRLPVVMEANIKYAVDELKERGFLIIGAEAGSPLRPWDISMKGPILIILGGEDQGLRKIIKERCDYIISLPLMGEIASLNVSVTAGALVFECVRQRQS